MEIIIHGNVGNVINISGGNPTIILGGGGSYAKSSSSKSRCPISTTKQQRTDWATRTSSVSHSAPDGWNAEGWTSEKAFSEKPATLKEGDPIFYWKAGCNKESAPSGFEGVYLEGDVMIIVPSSKDSDGEVSTDQLEVEVDGNDPDHNESDPSQLETVDVDQNRLDNGDLTSFEDEDD